MVETVHYEEADGAAVITLDRAPRNAFDLETVRSLAAHAARAAHDPGVRAVCVTGAGGHFCAGGDVKGFDRQGPNAPAHVRDLTLFYHEAITALARAPKPVLAAVDGVAAGGGFSLAIGCDVVVASARATFTYAYSRIGLAPDGGSSYWLPRLIGYRQAFSLACASPQLSAEEARGLGLVTEVVPVEGFEATWRERLRALAAGPTRALAATKRLLRQSFERGLEEQLAAERAAITATAGTQDFRAGLRALLERRTPGFEGR
jgi:2-(1,2-epoxy-1,2-dihydrophenyl)acetyl-CoA isomerase